MPSDSSGLLRPGDVVRLSIWREKDLSGDYTVDESGMTVFPKLGPRRVAGVSLDALKDSLITSYQRYLRNPSIDVTFLRRVTILGAVRKPGIYPLGPTMTVSDALAMAEGVSPDGQQNHVEIRRGGQVIKADLSVDTRIADSPVRSGDQLYVPERSWVSRNSTIVATLISVSATVFLTLALRH